MIRFENVYKSFAEKKVLQGLNLDIKKGEVFFILGGSGTGKSVALKSLIGLLKIDSGVIKYGDTEIQNYTEDQFTQLRSEISMVFQLPALLDSRSVLENLSLPIRHLQAGERWSRILAALKATQLDDYEKSLNLIFPTSLSYGEQKRVALARALVTKPAAVLYDEPTTGMDSETAKSIHKLIRSVAELYDTTSIVVSHDIANAVKCADRLAVMKDGAVVFCGTPAELKLSQVSTIDAFLKSSHLRERGLAK